MLSVLHVTRAFDDVPVLRGVTLDVDQREIVCLLGPSGCGKTTLLRIIAGLEEADSGDVQLNGQSIMGVPVHQRGFGLMFQEFALFPHLDVAGNVRFGLRMQGMSPAGQEKRLREVLDLVGLRGFEKRDVSALSGGERQRVALARSLAPSPCLLMLDEPLGSVDAALRDQLVVELRAIIKRAGLTALYVTHDQSEAFAIADRVAIMHDGVIEQADTPEALYRRPRTAFAARFLGLENVLPILRRDGNRVETAVGAFALPGEADAVNAVLLHPDGFTLANAGAPERAGTISGRVRERVFLGGAYRLVMDVDGGVSLTFTLPAGGNRVPAVGETIRVGFAPERVMGVVESA